MFKRIDAANEISRLEALMMEAVSFSEMSVSIYQTTRCNLAEALVILI
jgi:hypothetical protein